MTFFKITYITLVLESAIEWKWYAHKLYNYSWLSSYLEKEK